MCGNKGRMFACMANEDFRANYSQLTWNRNQLQPAKYSQCPRYLPLPEDRREKNELFFEWNVCVFALLGLKQLIQHEREWKPQLVSKLHACKSEFDWLHLISMHQNKHSAQRKNRWLNWPSNKHIRANYIFHHVGSWGSVCCTLRSVTQIHLVN